MTIKDGYYIAECTSTQVPISRKDMNTLYLPVNISKTDDGYAYMEYRFNLPINYDISLEVIEYMANEIDEYRKALKEVGVV